MSHAQEALERFLAEAMVLAAKREHSTMPERSPVTHRMPRKTQRILVMEWDVHQLLQEVDKVVKEGTEGQYRAMLDSLMRNSKELQDAMQNAGGAQYTDMQNMQGLVADAKAGLMAKMAAQSQQSEKDDAAKKQRELRRQVKRATELALTEQQSDSESEDGSEGGSGEGGRGADIRPMTVEGVSTRMMVAAVVAAGVLVVVVAVEVAEVEGDRSLIRKEFRQLSQLWQQPSRLQMRAFSPLLTPVWGLHWINWPSSWTALPREEL